MNVAGAAHANAAPSRRLQLEQQRWQQQKETRLHLLDLPDEILIHILRYSQPAKLTTTFPPITPSTSSYTDLTQSWTWSNRPPWPQPPVPPSLCAFAQVSRRGRHVATPLLYHAITLHTIASTNKLARTMRERPTLGKFIRHLHLPNDGLLHGASDRMADKDAWTASLQDVLKATTRLESIFLATRPGGEALQQLLLHSVNTETALHKLKRITISSLSFSFPSLGVGSLQAANLTHLHLIQWIPPTLIERFGIGVYQSLQSLRLSRIPFSASKPLVDLRYTSKGMTAQQCLDESIRNAPLPFLLLLRECIEQYENLQVLLLEMEQLADLEMPEGLISWNNNAAAAPPSPTITTTPISTGISQENQPAAQQPYTTAEGVPYLQFSQPGQLATLDFPNDVPLTIDESQEWVQRYEEERCRERMLHWSCLHDFKQVVQLYANEVRTTNSASSRSRHGSASASASASTSESRSGSSGDDPQSRSSSSSTPSMSPIEVRIVAPRPLGWDRNESLLDFLANAEACRNEVDCSAFEDQDIYELVNRYPHLGHDYGIDQTGRKVAYWTGALPRG